MALFIGEPKAIDCDGAEQMVILQKNWYPFFISIKIQLNHAV